MSSAVFTLVYVSSGLGVHIESISDAFYRFLGDCFSFVSTIEQHGGGIHQSAEQGKSYNKPYCVYAWKSEQELLKAFSLIDGADVVIYGGADFKYVRKRLEQKKLTFYSSERWFKKPFYFTSPKGWIDLFRTVVRYQNPNFYYLALGAYCANDARLLRVFRDKVFQFAYLVPVDQYDINNRLVARKNKTVSIMWCGRFIDWKHPEMPVNLAKRLVENGVTNFKITMVGDRTPLQEKMKKRIDFAGVSDYVCLTGGLTNKEVRKMMANSEVFLITSDRKEGWGAVLNEAMGEGCTPVVSNEIGSCPVLIKNGNNGLVFKSKSDRSLYSIVKTLITNSDLRDDLAREAYRTITGEWSVDNVAQRFINLAQSIMKGEGLSYMNGPCSKSYPIDSSSFYL